MATHYNAFISYRHNPVDSAVAALVQKELERYRIPKEIQKKTGIQRIDRIFRDKEELPITSDINDDLEAAIRDADFLIVILSPRTKESIWVEREIKLFLETHPRQKILTVTAEGEPSDIFLDVLTHDEQVDPETGEVKTILVEPLSCDFRQESKSMWKDEVTRLAASLLGCRYDDLRQRRRRYERRRMAAILGSVGLAATIFISYLIYSNIQINKANTNLNIANEQLNEANDQLEEANVELDKSYREAEANYMQALENQSIFLANASAQALDEHDRILAAQLALEALPKNPENPERPIVMRAVKALRSSVGYYDLEDGLKLIRTIKPRGKAVDLEMTSDGSILIVMDDMDTLSAWDTLSGTMLWEHISDGGDYIRMCLIDDKYILTNYDLGVSLHDLMTGKQIWELKGMTSGMDVSADASSFVVFAPCQVQDGRAYIPIYDTLTGKVIGNAEIPPSAIEETNSKNSFYPYNCHAGSPLSNSEQYSLLRYTISSTESQYKLLLIDRHNMSISCIDSVIGRPYEYCLANGNLYVLSSEMGGSLYLTSESYSLYGGMNQYYKKGTAYLHCFELATGKEQWCTELAFPNIRYITKMYYSEADWTLQCFLAGSCFTVDSITGEILGSAEVGEPIVAVSKTSNPSVVTKDGMMGVYRPTKSEAALQETFQDGIEALTATNGIYALVADELTDRTIYLYAKDRVAQDLYTFENPEIVSSFTRNIFSNGKYLATQGDAQEIICFDLTEDKRVFCITNEDLGAENQISILGFSDDGKNLFVEFTPIAEPGDSLTKEKFVKIQLEDGTIEEISELNGMFWSSSTRKVIHDCFWKLERDYAKGKLLVNRTNLETGDTESRPLGDIVGENVRISESYDGVLTEGERVSIDTVYEPVSGKDLAIAETLDGYYVLYNWKEDQTTVLNQIPTQIIHSHLQSWIADDDSAILLGGENGVYLYDGNGNLKTKIDVSANTLWSFTASLEQNRIVLLSTNENFVIYDLDGNYIGTDETLYGYMNGGEWDWYWNEDELTLITDNNYLCMIRMSDLETVEGIKYCVYYDTAKERFICYRKESDKMVYGSLPRYTLSEQIELAKQFLGDCEMTPEQMEYYGISD